MEWWNDGRMGKEEAKIKEKTDYHESTKIGKHEKGQGGV